MGDCTKNLYEILDIGYNATKEEIKLAYKRLVRIYHPDVNKSKDAEIKFKLLNNAYEILSDEIKRKNYDSLLNIKVSDFKKNEILAPKKEYFRKEEKTVYKKEEICPDNNSIIKEVKITEAEAKSGAIRTVNILNKQLCPKCMGKKFINGSKCAFCLGEGEKKELRQFDIEIKKNVQAGEFIYVGKVNSSALYDKKLFLKIIIEPDKKLYFEGDDIIVYVDIPYFECILGVKKEISVKDLGLVSVVIPPLTKPETKIKLNIQNGYKGNYFAQIKAVFPDKITDEEKKIYQKLKEINGAK